MNAMASKKKPKSWHRSFRAIASYIQIHPRIDFHQPKSRFALSGQQSTRYDLWERREEQPGVSRVDCRHADDARASPTRLGNSRFQLYYVLYNRNPSRRSSLTDTLPELSLQDGSSGSMTCGKRFLPEFRFTHAQLLGREKTMNTKSYILPSAGDYERQWKIPRHIPGIEL